MTSEQRRSALVFRTSERTDLGFTRDRHFKMRSRVNPTCVWARDWDPAVPDASEIILRFANLALVPVPFRCATRPGHGNHHGRG